MVNIEFYQSIVTRIQDWNRHRPRWMIWGILVSLLLIYYLLVITPLNNAVNRLQDQIDSEKEQIAWIKKVTPDMLRLIQKTPPHKIVPSASFFSVINASINSANWTSLVSNARQIDEYNVEISFNSISFNDLLNWLKKLYEEHGIFVSEASFQRSTPGLVQATLTLQRHAELGKGRRR